MRPKFTKFSSKIAYFQIRNFVRNGQISNKERGVPCRVGPCRAVSPIRFFDPILNNALALRASHQKVGKKTNTHISCAISINSNCAEILQIFGHFPRNFSEIRGLEKFMELCCKNP